MRTDNNKADLLESQSEIAKASGVANDKGMKPKHPATQREKVILCLFLVALTSFSLFKIYETIDRINKESIAEVSTPWIMPNGIVLKEGPAEFLYEAAEGKLIYSGSITAARKLALRDLLETELATPSTAAPPDSSGQIGATDKPNAQQKSHEADTSSSTKKPAVNLEEVRKSYNHAIDKLAYLSNMRQGEVIQLILVLGLLGGTLGAILRSLVDFVGHACYTNQLDLVVWWPLYVTRPIVGAILGFVLIVLFKAKLLVAGEMQSGDDSFWWLGVAVLGGFSTVDVTLRLRIAAKALFGGGSGEK